MNYKGIKDQKYKCLNCDKEIKFKSYSGNYHKYCDNKCQGEHRAKLSKEKDLVLFKEGKLSQRSRIYNLLIERDGNSCSCCGITEWQNKPIRFWVDHVDGNASNNIPNNLRLICPNCDSQSDTFGGRNRGSGRKSLGLKPYS